MNTMHQLAEKERESIIASARDLVRIPSVKEKPLPGKPFGEPIDRALRYMLDLADSFGFETKNVDGYAGHADFGGGDEIVGVLVHLDVVPEGSGWDYSPYGGEIHEGVIYGRGILDDKGPAVAALYAMKILKDSGFTPDKRIRLILGTDEESGWSDLNHYFQFEKKPAIGFSPDADFPLIHGEMGIQIMDLETHWKQENDRVCVISMAGGNAPNMVPDECRAVLEMDEKMKKPVAEAVLRVAKETGFRLETAEETGNLVVISKGVSAHGSTPEKGQNAISQLMAALERCPGIGLDVLRFLKAYNRLIGMEIHGESFGCGFEDDLSGKLVCNVGVISGNETGVRVTVNIRYPISRKGEEVVRAIQESLNGSGMSLTLMEDVAPLYVPKDHPLVMELMQVYQKETGDMESQPIVIGGGTYARALECGVAFGPLFPGQEEVAHQKNEAMNMADLIRITGIYAAALKSLATEKSTG